MRRHTHRPTRHEQNPYATRRPAFHEHRPANRAQTRVPRAQTRVPRAQTRASPLVSPCITRLLPAFYVRRPTRRAQTRVPRACARSPRHEQTRTSTHRPARTPRARPFITPAEPTSRRKPHQRFRHATIPFFQPPVREQRRTEGTETVALAKMRHFCLDRPANLWPPRRLVVATPCVLIYKHSKFLPPLEQATSTYSYVASSLFSWHVPTA